MSEWQRIETAPMREIVIAYCDDVNDGHFTRLVVCLSQDEKAINKWVTVPGLWRVWPSHWMPLPDPPKAEA